MSTPSEQTDVTPPLSPWKLGLAGARANLVPGICLQAFALALLAAYWLHAPSRSALEDLAALRRSTGLPFDVFSTALFGALLPGLVMRLSPATRGRYNLAQTAALAAFWAYKGLEVSLFYALQARVFGEGGDTLTIVSKTFVDQFVYCPLLAIPLTWLLYTWVEDSFSTVRLVGELRRPGFYKRCVLPLLIASWGVWTPAVAIVYLLPTALQLPLQNIVLCFFTLLLAFVTRRPVGKT